MKSALCVALGALPALVLLALAASAISSIGLPGEGERQGERLRSWKPLWFGR